MKKAIVFGASGLVGSFIVQELLSHPAYSLVMVVVRKDLSFHHPKLKVLIGNYQSLPNLKPEIAADEVFIALGTTKKKTPDEKAYYQVDHDYPVLAAQLAKEVGAHAVYVVSAVGANETSGIFYVRTKGEMERDITALQFEHTHIFRPSLITGQRHESRPLEKFFSGLWKVVNPLLIGGLKKYRGMEGKNIAKAMVKAAQQPSGKLKIYHWTDMKSLL
jgi:uncharacterized protein YbjT (DUF2867 family)